MKLYKITNLRLTSEEPGYNVYDFFDCDRLEERRWACRYSAENFADKHYHGIDENGVGVSWEIEEVDEDWELMMFDLKMDPTPEQVEASLETPAGWIVLNNARAYVSRLR
jgi:hypothetical protein